MTESVLSHVRLEDGVLRIAVATAERGTSLSPAGMAQGVEALRTAGPEVGAVLLVGEGANFCAGGDVRAFASAPDRGEFVGDVARLFHDFVRALDAARVPVVAAVQGWAAGAGMSIVLHADIALGGPSTKLRPAYPSIGFTPDGGMSWTLPRIVGVARAREIILTDCVLNADEAVRLGVLSRLVADDEVPGEAMRVARTLANGPTAAYAGIRQLLADSAGRSLSEQLDAEAAAIAAAANGPTGIEGVDAFVEKRRPDFESIRRG
ncbi:enoyl-CoA hydratase-related protein [Rhodococcus aetherivorans]|uniref:Enoyl-CoA hydratase n=1 Tax=Rhodococcus aetherivorans TaxID=191292 RepID=A0ABQ0YQL0_9NOCA|nr:enoyl-CoA hydratase-related protein [Rhodococcus aetherivorans]ETT29142.1 Enoyl-CoA hydratase/isomerase [Rhodococcus rhodochrous ATCC 21198]MDV6291596.1 enoyl-CoA hydratase-related protein [Rhodococcus aetherivorans]NGP27891.1 enoyl-CoA hydratase/isomerase family protein [Rhodococcus aetherivorans]GES38843.1 enoyl-CoA hydratase [Rhodococcus aetherivorans]